MAENLDPDRDDRNAVTIGVVVVDLLLAVVGVFLLIAIGTRSWNFDAPGRSAAVSISIAQKQYSQSMYLCGAVLLGLVIGAIVAYRVGAMGTVLFQCVIIFVAVIVTGSTLEGYYNTAHPVTTNYQHTTVNTPVCVDQGFCPSGSAG